MAERPHTVNRGRSIPVQSYWDPDTGILTHQTNVPRAENAALAAWASVMGAYQPEIFIEIMKDEDGEDLGFMPTRGNLTDAGIDFYSAEEKVLSPVTMPQNRGIIRTGVKVEIPPGMCLFLWDRSGLSAKEGLHRVAGVIDDSYRGEILVALVNLSHKEYRIERGHKIIQGILQPVILPTTRRVDSLSNSKRGENGFGSTGR